MIGTYGYHSSAAPAIYKLAFYTVNKGCRVDTETEDAADSSGDTDGDGTTSTVEAVYYTPEGLEAFT